MERHIVSVYDFAKDSLFTLPGLVCLGVTYLVVVQLLRFQRLRETEQKYGYSTRESMAKMTDDEAWSIQRTMFMLEFPYFSVKALQFALFKTYGIPTISKLLIQTTELTDPTRSLKRYADTGTLISEFMGNPPSTTRSHEAIARMNYLHSIYRNSGKISNDDMLYTLSQFALEPARWVDRYDWRKVTDLERCGLGTFWKSVGDGMEIKYDELPSSATGFKDGIHWLEELEAWSKEYEKKYMVPDKSSHETANETVRILLYNIPSIFHPIMWNTVAFFMDDRLRAAMMYEKPAWIYRFVFSVALAVRKLVARHLLLPRPYFMRITRHYENYSSPGPHNVIVWDNAPYYVKPTLWNRWGPGAMFSRMLGNPVPGDDGDKYSPNGFNSVDVGPKRFLGKGKDNFEKTKARLQTERMGGCPFLK